MTAAGGSVVFDSDEDTDVESEDGNHSPWENDSNCSSSVSDCETELRFRRDDGAVVNDQGDTDNDDSDDEDDGSDDNSQNDDDDANNDQGTSSAAAKWWQLEKLQQKEAKVKLSSTATGSKWYNTAAMGGRLLGGRREKGQQRKGFTQATQCYGPGKPFDGDVEYMQPEDETLMPIKIITEDFEWGRTDQMKRTPTEVRKPMLRKWNPSALPSIADMFMSMIEEPLEIFRVNTNVKGAELLEAKQLSRWQPLSNLDCIAYLAAMIRIQCSNKRTLLESWSKDASVRDPFICELSSDSGMSRRKYRRVMAATRLYDADAAALTGASDKKSARYDTQCRIRPFIDATNRSFQAHRLPGDFLSLDESMMRFTGRFADLQRMPLKPIRNGIKNFYVCDPDGYTYRILPHTTQTLPYSAECGYIFAVVWALLDANKKAGLDSYLDCGRTVVTDRYYTSVPIAVALAGRGTYYIGTIKRQSKNTPSMIEVTPDGTKRNLLDPKRFPRGASRFWFDSSGTLMYLVWSDSKPVHMLSSYPFTTMQQGMCERRQKGKSRKLEIARPKIVSLFNETMSGVDMCDQLLEAAGRHQRSRFWFSVFFDRVVSLAVVNLIAITGAAGRKMRTRDMKEMVAKQLWSIVKSGFKPRLTQSAFTLSNQEAASSRTTKTFQHGFTILRGGNRRACRHCHEKNANVKCDDCIGGPPLHAECWQPFHNGPSV